MRLPPESGGNLSGVRFIDVVSEVGGTLRTQVPWPDGAVREGATGRELLPAGIVEIPTHAGEHVHFVSKGARTDRG